MLAATKESVNCIYGSPTSPQFFSSRLAFPVNTKMQKMTGHREQLRYRPEINEVSFKKGEKPYMRDRIGGKVNAQTTGKWTRQVI